MAQNYIKDGKVVSRGSAIELDGMVIINTTHAQMLAAGYEVYDAPIPTPEPHVETEEEKAQRYAYRVSELIRERYSIDDELALHRQKESKMAEWVAYDTYCEECKLKAKEEVYGVEE